MRGHKICVRYMINSFPLHRRLLFPSRREILVIVVVNLLLRLSTLFQTVVNIDEPQYAMFALRMISGDAPYTTMIGEKAFFLYLFYYVVLSLFGEFNLIAVHAVTILWVSATAVTIYLILKQFADGKTAFSGALIYSLLTTMGDFRMVSTDAETLMNLPLCLSVLFFIKALTDRKDTAFLLTGLFVGVATHFRYQAGIQLAVYGTYLLIYEPLFLNRGRHRLKTFLGNVRPLLLITLSFLALSFTVFVLLYMLGSWDSYVYWTFKYELRYIKVGMETINALQKGTVRTLIIILSAFVVWFAAAETLVRSVGPRRAPKIEVNIAALMSFMFFFGFLTVCLGERFAFRYYTQLFPPLAVLAAVSFPDNWCRFERIRQWNLAWKRWALIIPAFAFWSLRFFSPWIHEAVGELDYAPFQKEIGRYVMENTKPDDTIYVWGWGQGIYFYSKRHPATRFINSDFLTGRISGSPTAYDPSFDTSFNIVPGSWNMFMSDLNKYKPRYIIDTSPANIHDYGKYPIDKYPELKGYLDKHYRLEVRLHGVEIYKRVDGEL